MQLGEGRDMSKNMKLWILGNAAFFSLTVESFILSSISVVVLLIMTILIFLDSIKGNKLETTGEKKSEAPKGTSAKKPMKHD